MRSTQDHEATIRRLLEEKSEASREHAWELVVRSGGKLWSIYSKYCKVNGWVLPDEQHYFVVTPQRRFEEWIESGGYNRVPDEIEPVFLPFYSWGGVDAKEVILVYNSVHAEFKELGDRLYARKRFYAEIESLLALAASHPMGTLPIEPLEVFCPARLTAYARVLTLRDICTRGKRELTYRYEPSDDTIAGKYIVTIRSF